MTVTSRPNQSILICKTYIRKVLSLSCTIFLYHICVLGSYHYLLMMCKIGDLTVLPLLCNKCVCLHITNTASSAGVYIFLHELSDKNYFSIY